eukprot:TRINITY_DN21997_c0_g1_i1.p1 TRINITY_DN21997_c0_g1~~TRINITY_DN21997_c0_g1_i1.p1  ORF type:complete len:388 (+),score=57.86 TRINITY_DN21997_c0_g1_i1:140-1165(+)
MGGGYDVETSIAEFIADFERTSIELPHMTTGQRKHVKKVLADFPELTCESFGFGQDRRLHLFKAAQKPSTKSEKRESLGNDDLKAETKVGSPTQSTVASARSTDSPTLAQLLRTLDLPVAPNEIQVRNTFIEVKDLSSDSRVVQSMPHGMFGRLLEDEFAKDARAESEKEPQMEPMLLSTMNEDSFFDQLDLVAPVNDITSLEPRSPVPIPALLYEKAPMSLTPSLPPPPPPAHLAAGTEVVIEGLSKCPAFNGLRAVVQSLDESTGRYNLLVQSSTAPGGQQWAKVRGENLRLADSTLTQLTAQGVDAQHVHHAYSINDERILHGPMHSSAAWIQLTAVV